MKTETLPRMLFVDDDPNVLEGLLLHCHNRYDVTTATCGADGLRLLDEQESFVVVLSDFSMPGMNGLDFLTRVGKRAPDTMRVLLTGHASVESAIAAVNGGQIFRFLTKPCSPLTLKLALDDAVARAGERAAARARVDRQIETLASERDESKETLRRTSAHLEQTLRDLQSAQERVVDHERLSALGQLASGIAHDVNNALMPIVGYAELMAKMPQIAGDRTAIQFLNSILLSATDAAAVVSRLREFYRGQTDSETPASVTPETIAKQAPPVPAAAKLSSSTRPQAVRPSGLRVLVVDDKATVRDLLREMLVADGHSVETVATGVDALTALKSGTFDIVLTDRAMPAMSGDELAVRVKQGARPLPVLMISGFGVFMSAADELPAGVDMVIPKPVTQTVLRDALARLLSQAVPAGTAAAPRGGTAKVMWE